MQPQEHLAELMRLADDMASYSESCPVPEKYELARMALQNHAVRVTNHLADALELIQKMMKAREARDTETAALQKDAVPMTLFAWCWMMSQGEGSPDDARALAPLVEKHLFSALPDDLDVPALISANLRKFIDAAITQAVQPADVEPCGGCGESDPEKRCMGCMHPFNVIKPEGTSPGAQA